MNLKNIIPTAPEVLREALIVLGGVLIASYVLSRVPSLKQLVTANSVTIAE